MKDYTKILPPHMEKRIGENDLFLEIFDGEGAFEGTNQKPPLLFVHGAYTGSWMWSRYIPHFVRKGWKCYVMNLRSHYRSRVMDMTKISFEDYLEDIGTVITECEETPIIIGFSLGGILCQKMAETVKISGLVLIDSCISKEANEVAPYEVLLEDTLGIVEPAPARQEGSSIDETEDDIAFQKKYLSMESAKVFRICACWIKGIPGVSIDSRRITCQTLVIKALNSEEEDRRGRAESEHLNAEYIGFWNTTHTGLLVGQKYMAVVDRILEWLGKYY